LRLMVDEDNSAVFRSVELMELIHGLLWLI
jgi:hypothetical protein